MKKILCILLVVLFSAASAQGSYCQNGNKGFKNSRIIRRYLEDLAAASSGFAVVRSIGTTAGTETEPGKPVTAILISENVSWGNREKPTVIITGAIHGNEWATPEVCIGIAEYLLHNRNNPEPARDDKGALINQTALSGDDGNEQHIIVPSINSVKQLLSTIQVLIIPVLNPEGYDFSYLPKGRASYYDAGWRENRRLYDPAKNDTICYRQNGEPFVRPPENAEHCFLSDYNDDGEIEEEAVLVCETRGPDEIYLFQPALSVVSKEIFRAIYDSQNPERVFCASPRRRMWKAEWAPDDETPVQIAKAKGDGYLKEARGVDLNRNFQYQWDVVRGQEHLFIRSRSYGSRVFRGPHKLSEPETMAMEQLIEQKNIVALIDYHSGSTQVLYPYAYSTTARPQENFFGGKSGLTDLEIFRRISETITALLNRHDRGDKSIVNFTAAQNYNNSSVGSGVARDCYYGTEKIAALNIEVHDRRYTYEDEEFSKIVPEICKTNVPGALWFLFWAAGLDGSKVPGR